MGDAPASELLNDLLEPFSLCLDSESARRIAAFQIDPSIQQRVNVFAERANEDLLTTQEREDYEALVNAADIIAILKLKAQRNLKASHG